MPDEAFGLTREEVVLAYRLILLREPESEEVILAHRRNWTDVRAFGQALTGSEEFRRRFVPPEPEALPLDIPANPVRAEADAAAIADMLAAQRGYWERIGEAAPHWSALPEARFLPENLAANRAAFDASGAAEARAALAALARAGRDPARMARVVEQGCGVGRITRHLAPHLARLVAADLSLPHLRVAAAELGAAGLGDIAFVQVGPERPVPLPQHDLWLCFTTLQHLPPPLALWLLRAALRALAPGGLAVFQLVTWIEGYAFETAPYLAALRGREMELHALPQPALFALLAETGCRLRELREAPGAGDRPERLLSNLVVAERAG
jgi:SAM-dependent methyltransferase